MGDAATGGDASVMIFLDLNGLMWIFEASTW